MKTAKVFISYSQDSPDHMERVLQLAIALRKHGVDATLDRSVTRPPEGWPLWCQKQLRPEVSDYVLVVCTASYLKRLENQVPNYEGKGSYWEGSMIQQYIYDEKVNRRFIPVLLPGADDKDIPSPIRAHTRYRLDNYSFECPGYDALYRELTGQPEITMPELGELVHRPPKYAGTLVIAPALPELEVKTDFQPEASDLPTMSPSSTPTKSAQEGRWLKRAGFSAVGVSLLIMILAIIWWLRMDQTVKLSIARHPARALQYGLLQIRGQPEMTPAFAKVARIIQWQQQDFLEDPLCILDMLDRGRLLWTNETTGLGIRVNLVFPLTNHYALLTNLSQPPEGLKVNWRLAESSEDVALTALLHNAVALKESHQFATQNERQTILDVQCILPFAILLSDSKLYAPAIAEDSVTPTADEFYAFATNAAHILSRAESLRILGGARTDARWMFVCDMASSNSTSPLLVLFHSKWKPKAYLQLKHGTWSRFTPEEWEMEYAVIMPPNAWNEGRAWKTIK